MEHWEDWSWQVKAYVALFKVEALRVLEGAELARSPITDTALERLEADTTELVDRVSEVQQAIALLTGTDHKWKHSTGCSRKHWTEWVWILALEFKFRPDHFEHDYSEWETLQARCERQSGSALPDSKLVATLLGKTTGALKQHLRLNVRSLDAYETVRNVITAYYQSRHVTGFRSLSDNGPAPMDVGAIW